MEQTIFYIVIGILVFGYLLNLVLDRLNLKTWQSNLPPDLAGFYTEEEYLKAKNYNFDHDRLSLIAGLFSFILMMTFLACGGFGWLNDYLAGYIENKIFLALAFFGILYFVSDILNIPFGLYSTFVIEEKYGFNKTTPKTYIFDKLKNYLLTIVLGGGIMALLLWLILLLGSNFWLVAFGIMLLISFILNMFYSSLIVPLFNKLSPLEEGELRTTIETYAAKVNFPLVNIFVIDGSKRSSKANAFFSGFWKKKKIVLYDTLIEKHSIPELVAVLAHEVGHYKKKHIIKGFATSAVQSFIMFFLLSLFIFNKDFTAAFYQDLFGFNNIVPQEALLHINLIAFAILYEPVSLITGLLGNIFSRKHEYQADEFAASTTNKEDLPSALKRLSVDHLSNLKPHPAYVFFNYSHPTTLQRLEAIKSLNV